MMKSRRVTDCDGRELVTGDRATYIKVENTLLHELPRKDQLAIMAQLNKIHEIASIDEQGLVEIEFEYTEASLETTYHTIWVDPVCLKAIGK